MILGNGEAFKTITCCCFFLNLVVLQMWSRVCISDLGDFGSICSLHDRNYTVEVRHPLRFVA